MAESQCPVSFAKPATPRNRTAIPAAMAHAGRVAGFVFGAIRFGKLIASAFCAGQTATHSRQPVHSTDRICTSLSTGKADGHAFAHLPQSMHGSAFRRIFMGLSHAVSPSKAPYGHRNLHQKFGTNTEAATITPKTASPVSPICRKKFSSFTS